MTITDFTLQHTAQAAAIAMQNYEQERRHVPALPPVAAMPALAPFAENGLGAAAFIDDTMVGFLCCAGPFDNAFASTRAIGVFSPMGANGAIGENRADVYARLYQYAGKKWMKAGAASHGLCLYAHDREAQEQFFKYGFGLRCVDAIREMDEIAAPPCVGYDFRELEADEFKHILPLDHMLDAHMAASPCFILRPSDTEESFAEKVKLARPIYMVAEKNGQIVAYIRAEKGGENFIGDEPRYLHVKGAFALDEHRGKGAIQKLLSLLVQKLKAEGYTRLGVDFESINPAAYGFWPKYFAAYTHGLVRRIDENVIAKR